MAPATSDHVPAVQLLHEEANDDPGVPDHVPALQLIHDTIDVAADVDDHVPSLHSMHALLDVIPPMADQVPNGPEMRYVIINGGLMVSSIFWLRQLPPKHQYKMMIQDSS